MLTRRRWGLLALALAAVAWILGAEQVSISAGVPENHFVDALTGLAFAACGIVALDRRPGNRIGPLMIAFAFVSYLGNYGNLRVPLLPLAGVLSGQAGAPILAQIALSYPSGRLRTRFDRFVVGLIYGCVAVVSIVIAAVFDPRDFGCARCAWEPAPLPSLRVFDGVLLNYQRAGLVLAALFLFAIRLRWRRATQAERRDLLPLWVAASLIALVYLLQAFASPFPVNPFSYLLFELQSVLQVGLPVVFAWGLLSTRLARSAVGDLVVELERPLPPGQLQAALARSLGDLSLELLYALDGEAGHWVNSLGRRRALPEPAGGGQARAVTVVERDGRPLAVLIHDPALEQVLVRATAAAAGMAIENERLHAEVRAQLEEVRASRQRIVEAGDRERRRVERNLHDGAQQRLATLALSLAMLRDAGGSDPATAASLAQASAELRQAIGELRELARGIHPAILTEEGLHAAVEALADRAALPVRVAADFDGRLPEAVEVTAYFVVSEALANVAKYAGASLARVELSRRNGSLHVEVTDDGIGGADAGLGTGLRGLDDRVRAVRGNFEVTTPPGGGTVVRAEIPCDA